MQLLEPVPQDIKTARDYTPCAPAVFRWIVVAGYLSILISALVWGLFVAKERQQNSVQNKDKERLEEVNKQIAAVHAKDEESQQLRARYEAWSLWLKGNYNISRYLGGLFAALPEGARWCKRTDGAVARDALGTL